MIMVKVYFFRRWVRDLVEEFGFIGLGYFF